MHLSNAPADNGFMVGAGVGVGGNVNLANAEATEGTDPTTLDTGFQLGAYDPVLLALLAGEG